MTSDLVALLEQDALRNIVLLKHLTAFPDSTRGHRIADDGGSATLVLLDTAASAYDRQAYPEAAWAALIASDHAALTDRLLDRVPRDAGVVFKLASDADRAAVVARFAVAPGASFLSYSVDRRFERDAEVRMTDAPGEAALRLFEQQGHDRSWLLSCLGSGSAFACIADADGGPGAVCFAFRNHGQVWEVGGVFTPEPFRGRGLAGRVVRTALAVLHERGLTPRYQVSADNAASIGLAESLGLRHFLTLTHHLRRPPEP